MSKYVLLVRTRPTPTASTKRKVARYTGLLARAESPSLPSSLPTPASFPLFLSAPRASLFLASRPRLRHRLSGMEPSPYGDVGGKIRRRPASRAAAATPYDRPPAAAAAHRLAAAAAAADAYLPQGGGEGGGWVSRLVDPASRLIAGGAARLFSTVFRKRLDPAPAPAPPLSTPPGSDNEPNQGLPESTQTGSTPILEKGNNPTGTSDDKALSEVEHLLMRKTFTRVEFDRLTDLLRARTVESDLSAPADNHENKNEVRTIVDGTGGSTSHGMAADHSTAADDPVCGASSPAELAKQYMNSRYLKEKQSNSLRSQVFLNNKAETSNIAYDRRPGGPSVQELSQFSNENSQLPVNGYVTPGLRGRSAIYRMSRSPFFKGPSSSSDINISPFSSSQTHAHSLVSGGRQVLKRRGADLENELGSIGHIRRIRQKSNMMYTFRDARLSPQGNFLPSHTIVSDLTNGSSPIQGSPSSKRLLLGTGQSVQPAEARRNGEDGKTSSDNVLAASPQSNKMAEKIFEQLNIIVPSPKEKQSLPQLAAGNASCSMSKQPVRQGNEPNSVNDPTSSLKFQPMDSAKRSLDPELNGSPSSKDKLGKDGSSKVLSHSFQDLGNKDIKSDNVALPSLTATTLGKPGFKMAVFEDLSEFDDDQEPPVPSKNSVHRTEVKTIDKKFDLKMKEQKVEPSILEQKVESNSVQKVASSPVSEKSIASPLKDALSLGLFSPNDPEKRATPDVPSDNDIGFKFPHVPSGTLPESTVSQVPLALNKDGKLSSASTSMFGLNQSSTSDSEPTNTVGVKTEAKLGESVTKPTTLDSTNLERGNEREKTDVHKSSDKVLPSAAPFHFASAASTTASLSNGFSVTSSPKLLSVTPSDKPAVNLAASTIPTTFAVSSSSPPISSSIPAIPTFNFGSSTSMVAATKSDGTNTEAKPASTLLFGTGGAIAEAKSTDQDTANKASPNLSTAPISSSISSSPVTSSSAFSSTATFSSSTVAASNDGIASTTSASTAPFAFSSSGNNIFGFNSPAQPTGLSTFVGGSTAQPSATSTIFGSKLPQSEGTMSQPTKSSPVQFSLPFPTVSTAAGASSSGSGPVSFGVGTASTVSGAISFGIGASSSRPSTVSFRLGASSSGTGCVSFRVGASSSAAGSFGVRTSSSGSGTVSFGAGTSSSAPGTVSFGARNSSSGPGTVSFGVTTSSPGSLFGNSPFGSGTTFSGSGSGFAFSSPSSSAGSSLTMASTSVFSSSSMASSTPAFSNPFGSSSSPTSMFTFGQSTSSGGGFSFGAQLSPAFSSQAPVFSFTSASTSMNSSTPQPAFGMTNSIPAFSMGSPGNDQMNVEDSMADDTNQATPSPAPIFGSSPFGQPGSSPAAPVFGAPAVQSTGVFQFGSQQVSMQQNAAFPPAGGSLEFQSGNFSLGSGGGGGDKSSRRVIKVKRITKKR